jgi:hypothetical protein
VRVDGQRQRQRPVRRLARAGAVAREERRGHGRCARARR